MSKVSDQARQAWRDADRQKVREAVDKLKTTEGWQRWLRARRHFHHYSLANQLLIASQRPGATFVAGFSTWLKLGYCIQRGERGLRIWVPIGPSRRALERWKAEGADPGSRPRPLFKLRAVFDRSQVRPLDPPAKPVDLDPPVHPLRGAELAWVLGPLGELAGELGCGVLVERMPERMGGYYEPASRRICLNERNPPNHQVKTLVHELSHALIRLERSESDLPFGFCEEELVVESIAYTVCGSIGLDSAGFSVPYLAAWSEQACMTTIELAAATIDRIAKRIEAYVIPEVGA